MQTECPHCHTLFRLREEQLEQADGQVQCGHCLAIFTAENPYTSQGHQEAESTDASETEQTGPIGDDIIDDLVPPELRTPDKPGYSTLGTSLWALGILLMILLGLAQLAYYQRKELVKYPQIKPLLETACQYIKCKLPPAKDTRRIKLTSKNVYTHPNIDKALMINATIVNQAEFSQAFPLLEVRFENIRGETIAARRFTPAEYLGIPESQIGLMEPGEPVSFNIEIIDPGEEVVSYAFEFL